MVRITENNSCVYVIFVIIVIIPWFSCFAQTWGGKSVIHLNKAVQGQSLSVILTDIETTTGVNIYYKSDWISEIVLDIELKGKTLEQALDYAFVGTDLIYFWMYPNELVIIRDPEGLVLQEKILSHAEQENMEIERTRIGQMGESKSEFYIVSGHVTSAETGEPISEALIEIASSAKAAVSTDSAGMYMVQLRPGSNTLIVRALAHEEKYLAVDAFSNGTLHIALDKKKATVLEEIFVQAEAAIPVSQLKVGELQLSISGLKTSPVLLGEADLIKEIQTLPGITSVGEAAGGFNVRGGTVDQNLILLDHLPIYNSSHLFGFFSTINAEAIQSATLLTGGVPARFGGRSSSVLDISLKEGDQERWSGVGGIGLLSSHMATEGPLKKNKTTLYTAIRTSYSNWLVQSIRTNYVDLRQTSARFLDGLAKVAHKIDSKTKLAMTAYASTDAFRLAKDTTFRWRTLNAGLSLQKQWKPGFDGNFALGLASYQNSILNTNPANAVGVTYSIISSHATSILNYSWSTTHELKGGVDLVYYYLRPGMSEPLSNQSNAKTLKLPSQNGIEANFFIEDSWQISERVSIEGGIRVPLFLTVGPGKERVYSDDERNIEGLMDTISYGPLEPIASFFRLEPRLAWIWRTSIRSSFKFGYQRINQFLHLASNTAAVSPIDAWQLSNRFFRPQLADQVSFGYFRDLTNHGLSISVESFYKLTRNIVEFKDGANLIMNGAVESDLLQGRARSYGFELMSSKSKGRLTGTVNYTFSRSLRQVQGKSVTQSINDGDWYPANFDQPHILNLSYKYELTKRHFFSGQFTYHTGRPVTIPVSIIEVEGGYVSLFSDRNQYRLRDYHRFDLAFVIEGNHRKTKRFKNTWVFSVYNVYGRENPYTVFFKPSVDGSLPSPNQLAIIGTVLPSITYTLRFE